MSAVAADVDLSGLRFVPTLVHAKDTDDGYPTVTIRVEGVEVDRREFHGYACVSVRIAKRLMAAIEAGAVFYEPRVLTDVNGKTFVSARSHVLGRMMNADLARLGF